MRAHPPPIKTGTQPCELREYAARRRWSVIHESVDSGFSGTSRPALNGIMADASQRRMDVILACKVDRFGWSVLHLNQQLAALGSYGVRVIAITQAPRYGCLEPTYSSRSPNSNAN